MKPTPNDEIGLRRIKDRSSDTLLNAIQRGQGLLDMEQPWREYTPEQLGFSHSTGYKLILLVQQPRMRRTDWERLQWAIGLENETNT